MTVIVPRSSVAAILTWAQRVLGAAGICALAYCGYVLVDAWSFQSVERALFQAASQEVVAAAPLATHPVPVSSLIGRIEIPRLGVSVMVAEGVGSLTLRRAAGHVPGTALPGQPGNIAISAHRDTFFRPIRNIRIDDIIEVTTVSGAYRYRVVSTSVVDPSDMQVLDRGETEVLTLITCYPFYFVGPAPQRFVVLAEKVS